MKKVIFVVLYLFLFMAFGNNHPLNYDKLGINCHIPKVEDLDLIKELKIGWIRVDFTWDVIEPKKGEYRWDMVERVIKNAEERNIKILAILGYCPPWASMYGDIHDPPKETSEWVNFVKTIVSRYKGRLNHFTIWNEPNSRTFFRGSFNQFIEEVFLPAVSAIRESNPEAKIVGPDLAHLKGANWDYWFKEMLSTFKDDLDIISHHCYKSKPKKLKRKLEGLVPPWDPPAVKKIIEDTGCSNKPFWLTEFGFRSTKSGEKKQADYTISFLKEHEKMEWIEKVFLYELKDSPLEPGFGIVKSDRTPKPLFYSLKNYVEIRLSK